MSTPTPPNISGFQIQGTFTPKSVAGAPTGVPVQLLPVFANLSIVEVIQGTYTPANDLFTVKSFLNTESPQFLFLIVDGQVNVLLNNAGGAVINELPVNRFLCFSNIDKASIFTAIQFDGRTIATEPMAQAVGVDYTLIIARAIVT